MLYSRYLEFFHILAIMNDLKELSNGHVAQDPSREFSFKEKSAFIGGAVEGSVYACVSLRLHVCICVLSL